MWAYLDESGDLGKKGSHYLVMTLLLTEDIDLLESLIRTTRKKINQTRKGKAYLKLTGGEIKYRNFPDKKLLEDILTTINNSSSNVFSVFIDKHKLNKNVNSSNKELIFGALVGYAARRFVEKNRDNSFKDTPKTELELNKIINSPKTVNELMDGTLNYIRTKKVSKITADLSYLKRVKEQWFCLEKTVKKDITMEGVKTKFYLPIRRMDKEDIDKYRNDPNCCIVKLIQTNSRTNNKLQALDLICGSIYDNLENGNEKNYSKIISRVKVLQEITKRVRN